MFRAEDYIVHEYDNPRAEAERRIALLEGIMQEFGAVKVGQKLGSNVYVYNDYYYSVSCWGIDDRINMMIESGETFEEGFEDSEVFKSEEIVAEYYDHVRCCFGMPHSISCHRDHVYYNGTKIDRRLVGRNEIIHDMSAHYLVVNEYETVYLLELSTGSRTELGEFYGDPDLAVIDEKERFCIVLGGGELLVYSVLTGEHKMLRIPHQWGYYILQNDCEIHLRLENTPLIVFNANDVEDGMSLIADGEI